MAEKKDNIPAEKFRFVHDGQRLTDTKFEDKPIGSFKDAWIRFRKNKSSVVAAIIILCIALYSFVAPVFIPHDKTFMCTTYQRKPARIAALAPYGVFDGGIDLSQNETGYIKLLGIGVAAASPNGEALPLSSGWENEYNPINSLDDVRQQLMPNKKYQTYYDMEVDSYLRVGFLYQQVEQAEYDRIVAWQEETGLQVLYPMVENNEYNPEYEDANNWYKAKAKTGPIRVDESGNVKNMKYSEDMVLEDNYVRDADGNVVYFQYTGGGDFDTAQKKIRVLYYNYYQYLYGKTPDYILGTDSQGYDLALRIAGGIQLSLLIAISVSVINFVLGAAYGAVEGYYGGAADLIMERISDILSGVPFIVVATLFQIHLASKVGPIPSLLFAYVLTGWIGTASRVRTQFYRFKNQEYVMAARTLGAGDRRIIWKHIFPNTLGTIITSSALVIPSVILSESMLSFLGIIKLGGAEQTSLGTLLSDASKIWTENPHLMLYPALVISLLMICFNLFGNGLRDAFNPALRGVEE